ncbi:malonyl-CoA decarboxylase [Thalassospira sp.]|uniref:malonyl-CoA decarboxylase n=1 Tax=Thalassospira sp. TaxID=1912094 RepID=UPI000C48E60A|nr:malonyl-CoA decarboxylase [Thalassospira sp.]MBC06037.1 malonyl-CoA decarboxylase [Thalassospira sp.]|tara:strand:+ start:1489 stop:2883 length:1395 start_codon:yes stop_codon:yes gene_type:complete
MSQTFLDRTLDNLRGAWRELRDSPVVRGLGFDESQTRHDRWREQISDCLARRGGAVSARARAAALGHDFLRLDDAGKRDFLHLLVNEFGVDRDRVAAVMSDWTAADDLAEQALLETELRSALVPPFRSILKEFNSLPQGVKFLVDLRADLLRWRKQAPGLAILERDLKTLLASWFDIGFLELSRITWNSPAALLEKLIAYEAVHAIQSWDDLKRRLASDRRCFAFFHPGMPDEPLIFVEVALVNGIAGNVDALIESKDDVTGAADNGPKADTAIFYSISNAQAGLAGISFGDFLIKRVVAELQRDLPHLKQFSTLSPIPALRNWMDRQLDTMAKGHETGLPKAIEAALNDCDDLMGPKPPVTSPDAVSERTRTNIEYLTAWYLLNAKRPGMETAFDPVAHFHLSNGARVERLNWNGNGKENGWNQSFGMMVNYLYDLSTIEKNHESYVGQGKIAVSSAVKRLLR